VAFVWAVRILLYGQLVLGFDRFTNNGGRLSQELHLTFGILIGVLALYAFRPLPDVLMVPVRTAARFLPLAPLVIGLGFRFLGWYALPDITPILVVLHVALAFATVGAVEVAAARQKRALSA